MRLQLVPKRLVAVRVGIEQAKRLFLLVPAGHQLVTAPRFRGLISHNPWPPLLTQTPDGMKSITPAAASTPTSSLCVDGPLDARVEGEKI